MDDSHELKVAAFTKLFAAWLAGKTIQIKDTEDDTWTDCVNINTIYHHTWYRVKPEITKYRTALMQGCTMPYVKVEYSTNKVPLCNNTHFIKYLTDFLPMEK